MSSKIDKVCAEIEKVKAKISEQQTRLRELERQKTELENTEIVELVRSLNLTPAALADFLKEQKKPLPLRAKLARSPEKERRNRLMMKTKSRMAAALASVFLCLPVFALPAYAQSAEPTEEPPAQEETTTAKPFTPEGTGTVVDNATDEDGKEFYTIQTPDEHVFFLVIDKQRTSENVYFLDAVTEKDLLSLAQSEKEPETVEPEPEPTPAPQEPADEPEPTPTPEPEKKDSPIGTILLVLAVAVIGGGAGWYFKIYRPKHQAPDLDEEEIDFEEEGDEPDGNSDLPPWDEDEPEEGDEPGKEDME